MIFLYHPAEGAPGEGGGRRTYVKALRQVALLIVVLTELDEYLVVGREDRTSHRPAFSEARATGGNTQPEPAAAVATDLTTTATTTTTTRAELASPYPASCLCYTALLLLVRFLRSISNLYLCLLSFVCLNCFISGHLLATTNHLHTLSIPDYSGVSWIHYNTFRWQALRGTTF